MEQKWVVFSLGSNTYGIDVQSVRSIERLLPVTRVPNAPAHVTGVINLRGVVTPVIDLRLRLGYEVIEPTEETRILIASLNQGDAGFVVDRANEVVESEDVRLEPIPESSRDMLSSHLTAIAKGENILFSLLDANALFEEKHAE